jgi:hypothetical protein
MTMWGYLVGLCHDTVVPEIFMEGVRRFVTCLMFCWSWLTCVWVQLVYFSTLTPDCFQGDVCSYNFCEFQICILIALIAVLHSYFCVAHSCIIWFDGLYRSSSEVFCLVHRTSALMEFCYQETICADKNEIFICLSLACQLIW